MLSTPGRLSGFRVPITRHKTLSSKQNPKFHKFHILKSSAATISRQRTTALMWNVHEFHDMNLTWFTIWSHKLLEKWHDFSHSFWIWSAYRWIACMTRLPVEFLPLVAYKRIDVHPNWRDHSRIIRSLHDQPMQSSVMWKDTRSVCRTS